MPQPEHPSDAVSLGRPHDIWHDDRVSVGMDRREFGREGTAGVTVLARDPTADCSKKHDGSERGQDESGDRADCAHENPRGQKCGGVALLSSVDRRPSDTTRRPVYGFTVNWVMTMPLS